MSNENNIRAQMINEWAKEIYQGNKDRGFWPDDPNERNIGELIALMHSELSEALEAHRKDLMDDKLPHRKGLVVEMADTLIRIFDWAGAFDVDLGGAIHEKLAYNSTRPYKHGKNY